MRKGYHERDVLAIGNGNLRLKICELEWVYFFVQKRMCEEEKLQEGRWIECGEEVGELGDVVGWKMCTLKSRPSRTQVRLIFEEGDGRQERLSCWGLLTGMSVLLGFFVGFGFVFGCTVIAVVRHAWAEVGFAAKREDHRFLERAHGADLVDFIEPCKDIGRQWAAVDVA